MSKVYGVWEQYEDGCELLLELYATKDGAEAHAAVAPIYNPGGLFAEPAKWTVVEHEVRP